MGSFVSLSSSSESSSAHPAKIDAVQINPGKDKPFVELITETEYNGAKKMKDKKYEVYIDRSQLHWFLSIKMKGSEFPYFTLEASTPDLKSLKREMYILKDSGQHFKYCGDIAAPLIDILKAADEVIKKMEYYSLWTSNCQHFCNNLLNYYQMETYRVTLYKEVTVEIERMANKTVDEERGLKMIKERIEKGEISDKPTTDRESSANNREFNTTVNRLLARGVNRFVGAGRH